MDAKYKSAAREVGTTSGCKAPLEIERLWSHFFIVSNLSERLKIISVV